MSEAIVIHSCICKACGFGFTSGAQMPQCPKCNAWSIEKTGTSHAASVPAPVPAGQLPDKDTVTAQVRAQAGLAAQVTYRCPSPGCGFTETFSPMAGPPGTITAHEQTHAAEFQR